MLVLKLDRSGYFTGTQAAGANIHGFNLIVYNNPYPLDIGFPGRPALSIGVADLVAGHSALTADLTCVGHFT